MQDRVRVLPELLRQTAGWSGSLAPLVREFLTITTNYWDRERQSERTAPHCLTLIEAACVW